MPYLIHNAIALELLQKVKQHIHTFSFKPRANGRNIVGCYMLRPFAHPVPCCWMLLRVVARSLKPVKLFSKQLPIFLVPWSPKRNTTCCIRLHSSSNIVGATHAHCAWFTKTYGLYPSHDALQVPTLLGVVASVCTQPLGRQKFLLNSFFFYSWNTSWSFIIALNESTVGPSFRKSDYARRIYSTSWVWNRQLE